MLPEPSGELLWSDRHCAAPHPLRDAFVATKATRSQAGVASALDGLTRAAESDGQNVFAAVVDAARAGCSNEEICSRLRRDLGFGQPLVIV